MNLTTQFRSRKAGIAIGAILLFLFTSSSVFSQVTVNLKNAHLGQIIQAVKEQTKFQFFYDDKLFQLPVGDVNVTDMSVPETLEQVLKDKDVSFKIDGDIVYLQKDPASDAGTQPVGKDRKITGTVVDQDGIPLMGVNISVKGMNRGAITDLDGHYSLQVPADAKNLIFSYIGFKQQVVTLTKLATVDVTLDEDTKAISEVVVTALGIKREKKMLGYAMQELKSDELNKTGDPSVSSALQGKVAGLQMNTSGTGLNGSTKITIRGNSSLTDNNQPLWVIDGVPFSDESNSTASLFGGVDRGSTSVDLNPDDIESISVLKGANAAALYGSRAGNGVILVTTKKGTAKEGFGVNYSANFTWTKVAETLHMQERYGQGVNGISDATSQYSFGGELNGADYEAWNGITMPYQLYGNKLHDYFQTGFSQNHNVSVGGVTDKSNYRFSFGSTGSDGVFNRESLNKINLDMKAGMTMNKWLSVDSKIALSRTKNENRPVFGKGGEVYQLLSIPNNIRLDDLKQYYTDEKTHVNWHGPFPQVLNPYYVNHQYDNLDERWRSFGYFSAKLNMTKWLFATAKYSYDVYRTKLESGDRTNGIENVEKDRFIKGEENFFEQNAELMVVGNNTFNEKWRLGYSLGGNYMYQNFEALSGIAEVMQRKDIWHLNSAKGFNAAEQSFREKAIVSAFATLSLAYNEWISLDLTARRDVSSTLPEPYFYPSASMSFLASDFLREMDVRLPEWLTFAKVRLSYAQVGKDTESYIMRDRITYVREPGGPRPIVPTIKVNEWPKPEIATSYEAGLDMKFFNNRLGFDFSYYHTVTKNQSMKVPMSGTWNAKWINAGEILNEGVELMIYSTPVNLRKFKFDLGVNLSYNNSTVLKLSPDAKRMTFNDRNGAMMVDVGAVTGGRLGDIYPLKQYVRDANGNKVVRNGMPLIEEVLNAQPIGNIQPDWLASLSPTFTFYGFYVSGLFDMKFGGDVVSVSEAVATGYGTSKKSENRGDIVIEGVNEDGTPNITPISAERYYKTIGTENGVAEEFLYDASYIKLKELSVGYSIPPSVLKKFKINALRVSLVGRNLCYLMKHTPGTSPEGGFDTSMYSQAIDFTSVPYSRTFGFSVNVGF